MEFETNAGSLRDSFISIITRGTKNNTYKFALARFLLDYCRKPDSECDVRYANIAESFFDYYWMQECKSRLQQGPANQVPKVIQIIREKFTHQYYPQSLDKIKREEHPAVDACIKKITQKCFDDVVPRFEDDAEHYFGRQRDDPSHRRIFFDYIAIEYRDSARNKKIDPGGGITLNPHAMAFLRENYEPLFRSVVLEWIKFLEKRNFGIPRLAEKIGGRALGPRDQARFKKYLEPFADKCFYCDAELEPGKCTHVDHVLPYDYVGDTDLWNLVLACQRCNCEKSGSLPPKQYVIRLKERNSRYRGQSRSLETSLGTLGDEYDIEWHYANAYKHGYPPWSGPGRQS